VTDFGIARELETDGLTRTGRVLGTTDYVSPEQAMGHAVDARTDIYSLGIVIYEMLVGKVPFEAETQVGVAMKHVNERIPNVQKRRPGTSAAFAAVVERATEKDPKKRYPVIGEMLGDLEEALEVEVARAGGASGEATTVLESVPERRRRILTSRHASLAGVLLVLAATAAARVIAGVIGGDEERKRGPGAPPGGSSLELVSATDFDPNGTGEPGEVPDLVGQAIDGDPSGTFWPTEHYDDSPDIAAVKGGVGIYVDASEPVAPETMQVITAAGGWSAEVYAVPDDPPETIEEWGEPIGSIADAPTEAQISLDSTAENRYFLLWFTVLPESTEDPGRYRAEVADIELLG
jgi:hypothetical protein